MADETEVPDPPAGLTERASAFWRAVLARYVLDLAEMQLLREACSLLSEIDDLRAALREVGVTVEGSTGQRRVNPAVGEIRQHRLALARVIKQLALPDVDGAARTDPRVTELARYAANQRWNKEA